MKQTIDTIDHLWTFTEDRVYILIAIARSKENEDIRATNQPVIRKVVENRSELEDKLEQLKHATSRFEDSYRLYATVNGRDAREAQHFLQQEILEAENEARKSGEVPHITKRIDHKWKSILHQERCRDQKRFLWDVDTKTGEAYQKMVELLSGMIILQKETPNGYHFITEPFNFNKIEIPDWIEVERKNDDMVSLGFM